MEAANRKNNPMNKKRKNRTPEGQFRFELDTCSKNKDLSGALSLYENAVSQNLHLNSYHLNTLLYLCSSCFIESSSSSETTLDSLKDSALEYGFRIFDRMLASDINPTEATITAVARLAAAKGDGDLAFELVKSMGKYNISPRLRSYGPALSVYCQKLEAEKAYSIKEHMISMGIHPEEPELALLMKVSAQARREEKVYFYLQKLRNCVRFVSPSTAEIIEHWFCSSLASEVGILNRDTDQVKDVILKNGGGWHGQGWLGEGKWLIHRSNISSDGCCCSCSEQLGCVDLDRMETEKFAESIASLAMERQVKSNFRDFQEWLKKHAEYKAIVDGANVGLYQQNFADGGFSLSQLEAVARELYACQKKWPLVILHNKRLRTLMENPLNQTLLKEWIAQGVLYTTPNGSNDDWYWLYAAVKLKCLLVTNDEMRDHIFETLGSNFFLKWKERHQVRFTFLKYKLELQMPPSYSVVIQESEKGSWHVPMGGECENEGLRSWLCVTRPRALHSDEVLAPTTQIHQLPLESNQTSSIFCNVENGSTKNTSNQLSDNKTMSMTGKRKDRSPSPLKSCSECH